jgi:hypothetical protein
MQQMILLLIAMVLISILYERLGQRLINRYSALQAEQKAYNK